jgi:predicted negative regulator of RcsB-dependent stress response
MAKRPSGSRRRTETHDAEDAFIARIVEFSTWAKKNTQVLILAGVVLVVAVVSLWYYVNYRENLSVVAAQELESLQQLAAGGDPETARLGFTQYLERFSGTPYASEARLSLAQLHLEAGNGQEAIQVLQDADVRLAHPMGPQVALLRARAYEELGRLDEAERVYLEIGEGAELDFQRVQALQDAARIRMMQGNAAGAADLYQRILDGMETADPDRGAIELRLGEARTRASTG